MSAAEESALAILAITLAIAISRCDAQPVVDLRVNEQKPAAPAPFCRPDHRRIVV